jgi:hypothetical protein
LWKTNISEEAFLRVYCSEFTGSTELKIRVFGLEITEVVILAVIPRPNYFPAAVISACGRCGNYLRWLRVGLRLVSLRGTAAPLKLSPLSPTKGEKHASFQTCQLNRKHAVDIGKDQKRRSNPCRVGCGNVSNRPKELQIEVFPIITRAGHFRYCLDSIAAGLFIPL